MIRSSVGNAFARLHGAAGSVSVPSLPAAPGAQTGIEISDVSHRFGDTEVLRDITLSLTEKRIAIVGANGSGKSTFSRLLNGLLVPDTGSVLIDGLCTAKAAKAVRRKVGFVFQNPDTQIVFPTVEEDVAFGLKGLGLSAPERAARVSDVLARYGLEPLRERPAHKLSGGQKQLLALAGVLITNPDYVVFDEPTTLLDLRNARLVGRVIEALTQTAIVVTHDLPLIDAFERVLVFEGGRIVADDEPSSALANYIRRMR
ncbi:cobalt ABC transporter ATP-binding protein [Rhodobacter sp. TJ_12]|uniref:energy-coupling factor ABC transporter ATP-binding protein n=1 Tax=Rhodobacter sp. TJ_12 TaxID=2029399 RepID=UPI001CC061C1|nr:ABC transporter ATP-binding protein [Rhodobacter sp. TJ_12]MBZ4020873.1 cobalt ABC transporter ATP-binding protein [Rhodobacter sp. TJ_12]